MMQQLSDALPFIFPFIIGANGLLMIIAELFFNKDKKDKGEEDS